MEARESLPEWRELSDGEVVRRVLDGDVELYRVLVDRYQVEFGRLAVAMLGDADAAEDALQEAFVSAYQRLGTCRHPDRFKHWLYRILANRCHDIRRGIAPTTSVDDLPLRAKDRADAATLDGELGEALRGALDALTPEQREAFILKEVEGRPYTEVAELTGVGVDALKMRVHRARDALRRTLELWK